MNSDPTDRAVHEVEHGKHLARGCPELTWGWGTPAGRLRAERRAALISQHVGLSPGMRVLEIGCGTGMFTELFAAHGATIIAIDISPDLIAGAKKRGLPEDRVTFQCKPLEDCGDMGAFDAVIGSSVLHHLDLRTAWKHIHRLLKPEGKIGFAEPNLLNPQVYIERRFRFLPCFSHVSPDETAFVRGRLKRALMDQGFADTSIQPFDWLHPATPRWAIPIVRQAGSLFERLPLIREFAGSLIIYARKSC